MARSNSARDSAAVLALSPSVLENGQALNAKEVEENDGSGGAATPERTGGSPPNFSLICKTSKLARPKKVRLSLEVSPEVNERLESLAVQLDGTKSDVLRRALVLMEIAVEARLQGKKIGLADRSEQLTTELIGI